MAAAVPVELAVWPVAAALELELEEGCAAPAELELDDGDAAAPEEELALPVEPCATDAVEDDEVDGVDAVLLLPATPELLDD